MAKKEKRSQAEKAVSASRKAKSAIKSAGNKTDKAQKNPSKTAKGENAIPARVVSSLVFLALFVILLITWMIPEGKIVELLYSIICGLIGRVGFIVTIPGMLYLFGVHAFSGERPVTFRTVCAVSFALCCGCLAHMSSAPIVLDERESILIKLFTTGAAGASGGVICGGISNIMTYLLNSVLSYIVLIVAALLTLLGAMDITVIGIIQAIQKLPKKEKEEEDPKPEPSEAFVNHIAQKHAQWKEERKRVQQIDEIIIEERPKGSQQTSDIVKQISDVSTPVAAAGIGVTASVDDEILTVSSGTDRPVRKNIEDSIPVQMPGLDVDPDLNITAEDKRSVQKPKVTAKEAEESAAAIAREIAETKKQEKPVYYFPPIDLLKRPTGAGVDGTAEMRENSRRLNETLESFKIEAHIINVTRGPSVTRYEVELEKGVRLSKLTTAADDIALSLGASGVRIAAVPGKISVVGIEVPNRAVTSVSLREVIDSQEFHKAKSMSSFAVGKDIGGNCIIGNIARLPHMLIAGTTGSGKSVCMNSIIISLLYKASPDDVKLIMVDPKMVELVNYNNIPHLLIPVVTDPKKAAGSLQWAVSEMMRRYKTMSDAGVRDLESYNSMVESQQADGTKLPQVVVIIDELADLMLAAAKEVEESICRIAQMGRAAGIHLIIATQRPSADVITGLMKANIPSRIAFAVASAMESRIILDTQGAEKLVGRGDMLYAPIGNGKPLRVQGCFVSEQEIEAVTNHVKSAYSSNYDQQIMEDIERKAAQTGNKPASVSEPEPNSDELGGDEMLPAAVDVILETGQASVSMLQRRLKLGYARAARIVDEMEEKGIVGPFQGSKPRDILITKEQWEAMRSGTTAQLEFDDLSEENEEEF